MKKNIFIFLLSISCTVMGQPKATVIPYDKIKVPGHSMVVPFSPDITEAAIKQRFKKMGVTAKEHKDFLEFKNVVVPEIRKDHVDAYVRIERKSKKEKDNSIISIILTEPGLAPGSHDTLVAAARGEKPVIATAGAAGLLTALNEHTEGHNLEMEIRDLEEEVKKAEKINKNLIVEGENLQQKLVIVQNQINENIDKQAKQAEELKKVQETLLVEKAKLKTLPAVKK